MTINSSIYHNVPLIPQPTNSTCWAASTAMLLGSTVPAVISRTPSDLVGSSGGLKNYSSQNDWLSGTRRYAAAHGLRFGAPMSWSAQMLYDQLQLGPIMFDMLWNATNYSAMKGSPGHMVVLIGMSADAGGITVTYNDPWAPNVGNVATVNYSKWMQDVPTRTYRTFWQ